MTVEQFANLYVYYLEPALRAILIIALVVTLLQVVNVITGGEKKFAIVDKAFNLMLKSFVIFVVGMGRFLVWLGKVLLKTFTVLFDTVRDFFTSKI